TAAKTGRGPSGAWRLARRAAGADENRADARRHQIAIDADTHLLFGQRVRLIVAPCIEPMREALHQFVAGQLAVLVGVERGHERGAEERAGAEHARPLRPAPPSAGRTSRGSPAPAA